MTHTGDDDRSDVACIAVVGEFGRGKSTLLNALLDRDLIPMGGYPNPAYYVALTCDETTTAQFGYVGGKQVNVEPTLEELTVLQDALDALDEEKIDLIVCLAPFAEVRKFSPRYARLLDDEALPCEVWDLEIPDGGLPDDEDEFFYVIDGRLLIDLEDKTIELHPKQGFTVPKGVKHRTRASERTAIMMMASATVKPTGD